MTLLAGNSSHTQVPERSRRILSVLVQQYIEKGEPVSSLWLAQHGGRELPDSFMDVYHGNIEPDTERGGIPPLP